MNPDYYGHNDIAEKQKPTSWKISDGSSVIIFKLISEGKGITITTSNSSRSYGVEVARKIWDDYIRRGYTIQSDNKKPKEKCKMWNMKEFHDMYRKKEARNAYLAEWQEARISKKKWIKYSNYPLEA